MGAAAAAVEYKYPILRKEKRVKRADNMKLKVTLVLFSSMLLAVPSWGATEAELHSYLMKDYVKTARPLQNASHVVNVSLGLTLQQIIDLDIKTNTLESEIWFNFGWQDEFLNWDDNENFKDIADTRMAASEMWTPDVEVYNSVERKFTARTDTIVLYKGGTTTWVPPYKIKSTCKADKIWYPFDDQKCNIKMGSWTYNGFQLDLQLNLESMDLSSFVTNSEWELVKAPCKRNEVFYDCCPEPYIDITCEIHLKRRTQSMWGKVIIPQYVLTLLTILAAIIPVSHASPRILVKFLMTLLLFSSIPDDLPDNSWMSSMISNNYQLVIVSLIIDVIMIVIHISSQRSSDSKVLDNRPSKKVWIMDIVLLILLVTIFIASMIFSLLSAPHMGAATSP